MASTGDLLFKNLTMLAFSAQIREVLEGRYTVGIWKASGGSAQLGGRKGY